MVGGKTEREVALEDAPFKRCGQIIQRRLMTSSLAPTTRDMKNQQAQWWDFTRYSVTDLLLKPELWVEVRLDPLPHPTPSIGPLQRWDTVPAWVSVRLLLSF